MLSLTVEAATNLWLTDPITRLVDNLAAAVYYVRRARRLDVHEFYQIRHRLARFLVAELGFPECTYAGANIRDAAMAENVAWILQREERIVTGAANGHLQRWPFSAPPIVNDRLQPHGSLRCRRVRQRRHALAHVPRQPGLTPLVGAQPAAPSTTRR